MSRPPHALTAILLLLTVAPLAGAQQRQPVSPVPPAAPAAPGVVYADPPEAREIQEELRNILRQYPPSVRQVLTLDPSLLSRPDYMAPYPALVAFLQLHPEVSRNPSYFFGEQWFQQETTPELRKLNELQGMLLGAAFFSAFIVVISIIYSLLRQAIEYRRWRRQVQIQIDMQNKLVDKLSTSQELQAYLENSGGRRLMEWPALPVVASPWGPLTRILWGVQIGIVIMAVGAGFLVTREVVPDDDFFSVFQVMGTMAIAVGIGFVVSAVASWMLSARLGLLQPSSKADA